MQVFFEYLKRLNIKVVGRLVEYQEVRIVHQYSAQIELALLATRQFCHVVVLHFGREKEVVEELRRRHVATTAKVYVVGNVGYDVDNLLVVSEFQSVLREVTEADGFADVEFATVGAYQSDQHLDECRLARAVVAHDSHLFESGKVVVEVFQYDFFAERLRYILALKYLAANVNVRCFQADLPFFDALQCLCLQFVEGFFAIARLVSACLRLPAHPL